MRDSILNVRSSGLGKLHKITKRTIGKRVRKGVYKAKTTAQLNIKQNKLERVYKKQTASSKKSPRTTEFRIKRPSNREVKGTIHPIMKNYKVPKLKYDKWGDRIS
jgi:CRISPR/Cas system CSM-associated protein Csm2 small subunit